MSPIRSSLLLGAGDAAPTGAQVSRSLRFDPSSSSYLSRTPSVAGSRTTWTWVGWVKANVLGTGDFCLFSRFTGSGGNYYTTIRFNQQILRIEQSSGVGYDWYVRTTRVFRDPSAWYHIIVAVDTNLADANSRVKLYVNGVEESAANFTRSNPAQYSDTWINTTSSHSIGEIAGGGYFDGYLANLHFIDGQALTPSSFTETDATTGQLIPKTYTGSYGTNGFNLLFADNSSNTASTLGKDYSGLGNNWTPNNFSVTAGAGNDSLVDSPTNYGTDTGVGGEVRGNYATLNPLDKAVDVTLTNGNLDISHSGSSNLRAARATIKLTTGKWYCEAVRTTGTDCHSGIITGSSSLFQFASTSVFYGEDGKLYVDGSVATNHGITIAIGDVVGIAVDMDAAKIYFYKNGTLINTGGTSFTTTGNDWFFKVGTYFSGSVNTVNFGQRPFAYTAPSGYKALCTQNLPAPLVTKSNTVFDVVTYTGNSTNRNITGLAFSPDLVWTKCRSSALDNKLQDIVRGATAGLISNSTGAETTDTNGLLSFNSDGYSLGIGNVYNGSGDSYVGWAWDAGTSTVSNTQGSITSQVRANATAGFSVVTYTGNGTGGATVGHGLGVAPSFIIHKCRSVATNWFVYHGSAGNGAFEGLNTTAAYNSGSGAFGSTAPTSTVLTTGGDTNTNGRTYVDYCFAPVVGYSSFGSYSGTGTSNGSFVYTGFRPRWIMVKSSDWAGGDWTIIDAARDTYNVTTKVLLAQDSYFEQNWSQGVFDILSNGFKVKYQYDSSNRSGVTYIYMAFAESPINYSRAR